MVSANDVIIRLQGENENLKKALSESKADLEALGDSAVDAGQEGSKAQRELEKSVEDTAAAARIAEREYEDLSGTAKDTVEFVEALQRENKALKRSILENEKAISKFGDSSEEAGREGVEAQKRIKAATDSLRRSTKGLAEGVNLAEQAYEDLGGSPAEFLARANTETERAVILLADLQKNIDQVEEESREGLGGFADRAAKARQRSAELNEVLERMGDKATPELRAELARLDRQFEETFPAAQKRAAALEREMRQIERATQGTTQSAFSLQDVISTRFPKAATALLGVTSAVFILRGAFQATRQAIDFLKQFGIDLDEVIRGVKVFGVGIDEIADKIVNWGRKTSATQREQEFLANAVRVLNARGIEFVNTQAGITAAYDEMARSGFKAAQSTIAVDKAVGAFIQTAAGFEIENLAQEVKEVLAIFEKFNADGTALTNSPFLTEFAPRIEVIGDALRDFGPLLTESLTFEESKSLQGLILQFVELQRGVEGAVAAEKEHEESLKRQEELAKRAAEQIETYGEALAELSESILSQAEELKQALADSLTVPDTSGVDALTQSVAELEAEQEKLANQITKTVAELNREDEISNLLFDAKRNLATGTREQTTSLEELEQQQAATKKAATDFADSAQREIDALKDKYDLLETSADGGAQAIVDTFKLQSEHSRITAADVEVFKTRFEAAMLLAQRSAEKTAVKQAEIGDAAVEAGEKAVEAIDGQIDRLEIAATKAKDLDSALRAVGLDPAALVKQAEFTNLLVESLDIAQKLKQCMAEIGDSI